MNHPAMVTPVQLHADHATQKWLGNWTTARAFGVRARQAQLTIDLRSPHIPAGDIDAGHHRPRLPPAGSRATRLHRTPGIRRRLR